MMSLADSIYESNGSSTRVDPLVESLISLALEKSASQASSAWSMDNLHRRGEEIWQGQTRIERTTANIYKLTEYTEKILEPIAVVFWEALKRELPVLDMEIFQISKHLFWDRENGEILTDKQVSDRFRVYDNDEKVPEADEN